jgi:subtilisin family serine protease
MKVTVKYYLNVRVGKPSVNAPCYQYIAPGSEIEVDGKLYPGDMYEGIDQWMRDEADNYYWSGGFNQPAALGPNVLNMNWGIGLLGIDKMWSETTGKSAKVAVLDTGIVKNHPDFNFSNITGQNFVTPNAPADDADGHGTHDAGTIAANGPSNKGIAPDASLYIYKVMDTEFSIDEQPVLDAIDEAIKTGVHIISMSFALASASPALLQKIQNAAGKGIIMVAASGNEGMNTDRFPSCYTECLCIGAIDKTENVTNFTSFPKRKNLDLLAPGADIFSTYLTPPGTSLSGTSMSTAFVSGVIALLMSWVLKNKPALTSADVVQALKDSANDYGAAGYDKRTGYGIINPVNALLLLKNK